jgi:LysM repeat protein
MKACQVFLIVLVACLAGQLSAQNCNTANGYLGYAVTIQAGQTVGQYNAGGAANTACVNAVASANNLANPNNVAVGQYLCIPNNCYFNSPVIVQNCVYVQVQPGQTVGGFIAGGAANTACVNAVASANNLTNVNLINVGQQLCIPPSCYAGSVTSIQNCVFVNVNSGNTVGGFVAGGAANTVCVNAVASANNLANVNTIYAGEQLCIPSNCYANTATAASAGTCPLNNGYSGYLVTVQSGQTVGGFVNGGAINTECVNAVASFNNLPNANNIQVGQVLCIPYNCYANTTATSAVTAGYCSSTKGYSGYSVTVQAGQTVGGLVAGGAANTACVNAVGSANNLANVNLINAGQQLCIPSSCYVNSPVNVQNCVYVQVQPGQTVGGFIAGGAANTACVNAVASANNLTNVNLINAGQQLCIPSSCYVGSATSSQNCVFVTVVSGNTVGGFVSGGASNTTCVNAVALANNLPNPSMIYPGQQLCIPSNCYVSYGKK